MAHTGLLDRRPACISCHRAKRKCNKSAPACLRCRKQNLACRYPLPKPSAFTPLEVPEDPEVNGELIDFAALGNGLDGLSSPVISTHIGISTSSALTTYSGSWFLEPETFLIDHTKIRGPPNFRMTDLNGFVQQIQRWLEEWTTTGKNCFIHAQLYRDRMPSVAQVAFTTLSAYLHRTPRTTEMILRAVNDRAGEVINNIKTSSFDNQDVIEIIAQAHALLIYQVIGCLDGDIRSRTLAEGRYSTFETILGTMHENASTALRQTALEAEFDDLAQAICTPARMLTREWQSWIVSESVRRTWLVGKGFIAAYAILSRGELSCGGDLAFTTREGLWEAEGAHAWSRLCIEKDVQFVGRFRGEWLFSVPPGEVDEFAKMMLEITFGKDRMACWLESLS